MHTSIKTLACTAALACMGVAQAQDLPASVWFDGFCDGLSNITAAGSGVVTGYYDVSNCAGYGDMLPSVGAGGSTVKSVGIDYTAASFDTTGFAPLLRIYANGTYMVYWPTGRTASGTWTEGAMRRFSGTTPVMAPR